MIALILILFFLILFFKNTKEHLSTQVANETDIKRATKFALRKRCESKGYKWYQGADEFVYDCKHTKETCLRDSVYNPDEEPYLYLEWRPTGSEDAKAAGFNGVTAERKILSNLLGQSSNITSEDEINNPEFEGVCISGNVQFRKFCENEGLKYDPSTGKCTVTKEYCNSKGLEYCNEDCFEDPGTWLLSSLLGDTVGRSLGYLTGTKYLTKAACAIDDSVKGRQ